MDGDGCGAPSSGAPESDGAPSSGGPARACKRELDATLTDLPNCYGVTLAPGERVVAHTAGGGGYGSPLERDPARVKHDLDEGWITRDRAEQIYGLVLDRNGVVDLPATSRRRQELSPKAISPPR